MPEEVGNTEGIRLILGKHSGRNAVRHRLADLGLKVNQGLFPELFEDFKSLAETVKEVTDDQLRDLASKYVS